ncbi:hypothetical protein [Acidovorax sp. A1169]|uniref:hypothetical protein n=1 Tax=Acidovorax sp. A1169 TaxID=3059524 RepID=UPI00273784E0|nr:hypothetical protein [Acidovorax sp. A1169]MDP4076116.1 hypothetical protein [Acidovorax sp. A1169]
MQNWLRSAFRLLLCIASFVLLEVGVAWGASALAVAWYRNKYGIPDQEDLSNDMGLGMVLMFSVLPVLFVAFPFSLWGSLKAARKVLPER